MHLKLLIDILGWLGAVLLLAAYFLVSSKRIEATSTLYQVMNIVGSSFLVLNAGYYHALPSAFVNAVWIGIGVYSLILFRNRDSFK
ncbi:MAG: CBU_0592 family membrane protein [Candidatus Zhuqueibacterota bacterium]